MANEEAINRRAEREGEIELFREMLRIRRFEEKCAELYGAGLIRGFLHLCNGEEAIAVGAMHELTNEDAIVSTYREHGHALARGLPMGGVMAELYGKANGCSGGRGGSMHLFDLTRRFYGGYAIVGGGLPIAIGLALAERMRRGRSITACFFGDGAVAEGEFHESMNLAALWGLPVLFICENNLYAMGTALHRHQARTDIAARASGYGMEAIAVDGMNISAVREAVREATAAIRRDSRPFFVEARTYRFRAHSMYDAELYRDRAEVENWKQRCPLALHSARLAITEAEMAGLESSIASEINEAISFAEAGEWEPVSAAFA